LFKESLSESELFNDSDFEAIERDAVEVVEKSIKFADESPFPDASELFTDVYA
jgi:pyruvate dehydrogenase E1 component alpha subunit